MRIANQPCETAAMLPRDLKVFTPTHTVQGGKYCTSSVFL